MNSYEIRSSSGAVIATACGKCDRTYQEVHMDGSVKANPAVTDSCCVPHPCRHCQQPVPRSQAVKFSFDPYIHEHCRDLAETKRLMDAPLVPWPECVRCDHCDEYFHNEDEFLDRHDDGGPYPSRVWACEESDPIGVDANGLIEEILEEHAEENQERISSDSREELQALLDAWCDKQEVVSFFESSNAVDVSELFAERRAAELSE